MFICTDLRPTERVVQRMNAGVQVVDVWDQLDAAIVSPADVLLCLSGAQIKIEELSISGQRSNGDSRLMQLNETKKWLWF